MQECKGWESSNWPPGTPILSSCHRQPTAQKSRSPRFPPPTTAIAPSWEIAEKKWERGGLPCPNRSLFPTLVQKVSKKENTTKIFLKLSFFGNISVCVVAVKAVYWGTGPVSGVGCCCDSLGSTSRRAGAAAASKSAAATHSELRTAFEIYSRPHKFPAKLEKEKIPSFWTQ